MYGAGRMPDESRTCHHSACRVPASVALAFRYDSRQVWLRPLGGEAHPGVYELCADHADRLTVPRGWSQIDERGRGESFGAAGDGGLAGAPDGLGRLRPGGQAHRPPPTKEIEG